MTLTVHLQGIGVYGPGLTGWAQTAEVLAGRSAYTSAPIQLPAPEALPAAERRRAGTTIKLAFAVGFEAIRQADADASTLRSVFTSSGGDCDNCHAILETLASADRAVSPTRFHNSVHNAAAGYWGIATRAMAPCQVIGAYDASFGAGLLDALAQVAVDGQPVLLIAYDSEYPEPLRAKRDTPDCGAVALLLSPEAEGALGVLTVAPTTEAAEPMPGASLEALRTSIPAMRALPLLRRVAAGQGGEVVLDYLAPMQLRVGWRPC